MAIVSLCRAALVLYAQSARVQSGKDRQRGRLAASRYWANEAEELEDAATSLPRCHGNREPGCCRPADGPTCRRGKACLGRCLKAATTALAMAGLLVGFEIDSLMVFQGTDSLMAV